MIGLDALGGVLSSSDEYKAHKQRLLNMPMLLETFAEAELRTAFGIIGLERSLLYLNEFPRDHWLALSPSLSASPFCQPFDNTLYLNRESLKSKI